jgi:exodeoxyribonuclease V beta subunit
MQVGQAGGDRHWTLGFDRADAQAADLDRLREDLRLWYVALTRARHALWVGWSPIKRGNGKKCVNHDSAAGRLLAGGDEPDETGWWPKLQALQSNAQGLALSVQFVLAPQTVSLTRWQRTEQPVALREAFVCNARIDKTWGIASFSRLTRGLSSQAMSASAVMPSTALTTGSASLDMATPRPADDEPEDVGGAMDLSIDLSSFLTLEAQGAPVTSAPLVLTAPWHSFARGPSAGNFLHDQMEWLAADGFSLQPGSSMAERLVKRCERAGYKAQADGVVQWLSRLVAQPLGVAHRGPHVALNALQTVLPEMEFWLPAERLHAREIDALCQQHLLPGVARPQLPDAQLHGMLMGFADLVFEHAGRYWVLDYKSNHLGAQDANYTAEALDQAIQIQGGNGMALEYGLADLWFIARLHKTAPVSREMILNFVAQHSLGQPKSY